MPISDAKCFFRRENAIYHRDMGLRQKAAQHCQDCVLDDNDCFQPCGECQSCVTILNMVMQRDGLQDAWCKYPLKCIVYRYDNVAFIYDFSPPVPDPVTSPLPAGAQLLVLTKPTTTTQKATLTVIPLSSLAQYTSLIANLKANQVALYLPNGSGLTAQTAPQINYLLSGVPLGAAAAASAVPESFFNTIWITQGLDSNGFLTLEGAEISMYRIGDLIQVAHLYQGTLLAAGIGPRKSVVEVTAINAWEEVVDVIRIFLTEIVQVRPIFLNALIPCEPQHVCSATSPSCQKKLCRLHTARYNMHSRFIFHHDEDPYIARNLPTNSLVLQDVMDNQTSQPGLTLDDDYRVVHGLNNQDLLDFDYESLQYAKVVAEQDEEALNMHKVDVKMLPQIHFADHIAEGKKNREALKKWAANEKIKAEKEKSAAAASATTTKFSAHPRFVNPTVTASMTTTEKPTTPTVPSKTTPSKRPTRVSTRAQSTVEPKVTPTEKASDASQTPTTLTPESIINASAVATSAIPKAGILDGNIFSRRAIPPQRLAPSRIAPNRSISKATSSSNDQALNLGPTNLNS
jgi:hypothetical protein